METVTLNKQQVTELLNEAAQMALDLDHAIRENLNDNSDRLIRKSIAGISSESVTKRFFQSLS